MSVSCGELVTKLTKHETPDLWDQTRRDPLQAVDEETSPGKIRTLAHVRLEAGFSMPVKWNEAL